MARPTRGLLAALVLLLFGFPAIRGHAALDGWDPVRLYRVDYVPAADFAARYGLKVTTLQQGKRLRLESQWTKIELERDSRDILWNGLRLYLGEPVAPYRNTLAVALTDVRSTLDPLLRPQSAANWAKPRLIAIDAGHGGRDSGTENKRLKLNEKTFTLDVARRLKVALENLGYRTVFTRGSDAYVSLEKRPELANRHGADLFISIHFNSLGNNAQVHGVETYAFTPAGQRSTVAQVHRAAEEKPHPGNRSDHWNILLATSIHRELIEDLGALDRGVKRARFAVLNSIRCPAVLVEAGFLSSSSEAKKIATAGYREKIARAIAAGVERYVALLDVPASGGGR